jgi:Family of unknown function (DUF6167)
MKRIFWLIVGAAVGVLVVRKLTSKAAQLTPQGLVKQLSKAATDVADSVRGFTDEVRVGMAERENELRDAVLADHQPNGHSGLDSAAAARLAQDPDAHWRTED